MKRRAWIGPSWGGGHRLMIIDDRIGTGKIGIVSDFVWREYDEGGCIDHMEGIGHADELIQSIVNEAWKAGFRPSGFGDVKNETAAIRDHLTDMKRIAFHKLGIE